jgi:rubredoxin
MIPRARDCSLKKYSYHIRRNSCDIGFSGEEISMTQDRKCARWVCLECHYIYDPAKGDPKNGVPAGTTFEEIPDSWRCPECKILKAKKGVFKRLDE